MWKFNRSSSVQLNVARSLLVTTGWVLAALPLAPTAFAATLYVAPTGQDFIGPKYFNWNFSCDQNKPCKTIQWAVLRAQNGDTISVAEGHYVENVTVSKNLTIKGVGGYLVGTPITWVDGNKQGTVFTIPYGVTAAIRSMLISNGT